MIPLVVLLSVLIVVASCGCPHSANVVLRGSRYLALMNNAAISASAADSITCLMTFEMIDMGQLLICVFSPLFPKNVYHPSLDLDPATTRYASSE